jgi:leader peptidase (prepilin peptidase)/N-methyltransferase
MDALPLSPLLLHAGALLLGLLVGSFLNVVVYRLPRRLEYQWRQECAQWLGEPPAGPAADRPPGIVRPGSRCPHCGHGIRPWENIPILSYLFLRGRCSAFGGPIGLRYPFTEALTGLLTLAVVWQFGPTPAGAAALGLTWVLIALSLIDYDTQLLPDLITLPALWAGLLLSLTGLFTDPVAAILGAAAGYLSLWSVFQLFRLLTGKEGMGYGDFKLLALLGAWLGWQHLLQIVMLSAVVGALTGLALILTLGRDRNLPIPFGPYLAAAGWISLLWGDGINRAYLLWAGLG